MPGDGTECRHDAGVAGGPKLYKKIPGADKLMFRVEGWDHNPMWERKPSRVLQHMSWKWLEGKKVYGVESGSWAMDTDGVLAEVE